MGDRARLKKETDAIRFMLNVKTRHGVSLQNIFR